MQDMLLSQQNSRLILTKRINYVTMAYSYIKTHKNTKKYKLFHNCVKNVIEQAHKHRQIMSQYEDNCSQSEKMISGNEFSLEKMERGKRSQYLSMRNFAIHRQLKTQGGKTMQTIIRRRPVNKILNNNRDFAHQDDVLDLLFTRNHENFNSIRKRQIDILNKFYKKSAEKISSVLPNGTIAAYQKKKYCKIPKLQFKACQNIKIFEKKVEEERYKQRQTVARSFVFRDYGLNAVQAEMAQNPQAAKVQMRRYRNLLVAVLTEAFRKMQSFAIEHCLMGVKPLNRAELKVLFIYLINCRTHLSSPDCETLLKYVTICFCLGDISITSEATVKLMSAIHEALKRRMQQKSGEVQSGVGSNDMVTPRGGFTDQKYQMHKIWNGQMERLLLESYRRDQDLNKIAKIFKRTYPKKQCFFTTDAFKTRLNRTLRESIKKLQFLRESETQHGLKLPQITKMSKFSFRAIMESPKLYRLRLMLLDVNTSDNCSHNLVHSTIKALNETLRTWQSIRAEQERQ